MTVAISNIIFPNTKQSGQSLLNVLEQIRWSNTTEHLIDVEHIESTHVAVIVQQCQALLVLAAYYSHLSLVPTCEIDTVIHTHIKNSSQPHANYFTLAGISFRHSPGLGTRGASDRRKWLAAFKQTQRLFKRHFGSLTIDHSPPACCEILLLDPRKL